VTSCPASTSVLGSLAAIATWSIRSRPTRAAPTCNALTAAQEVRLSRAVVLRLELDDIESRKLQGAPFDAAKYIVISEAFERLVGGQPDAPATRDFSGAREELERFVTARAEKIAHREQTESERLRAKVADLAEENEKLRVLHACSSAQPASPSPPPPSQPTNVVAIKDAELLRLASRTLEPRRADERARRDHINASGSGGGVPGGVLGQPLPSWWGK
jgi:hypothetical protein